MSAIPNKPQAPESGLQLDFALPDGTLESLQSECEQLGDIFRMRSTREGHWAYLINSAQYAEQVLGPGYRHYRKGMGIDRVNILLGRGLMVSEGDFWKSQRRMVQPAFRRTVMAGFIEQAIDCTLVLADEWADMETVELSSAMSHVTLDFVLKALFSDDLASLTDDSGASIFALVEDESARDLLFARKFRALTKPIAELMDQRRAGQQSRSDLLALLMNATDRDGQPMPDKQVVDEVLTLIIAGHETTAAALTWTWLLLAEHPGVEAKLHDEVSAVLGDGRMQADCISKLVYTRQVIDEALRLYPPGWMLARRALEDDQVGDFVIEAGSDVLISPYLMHRHTRYWSEPDAFDPERFSPSVEANRPKYAYIPFSAGARNCIGEHAALAEMTVHVALLARRFKLRRSDSSPIAMEAQINLRPRGEINTTIVARD